jgi:hypothetical protein
VRRFENADHLLVEMAGVHREALGGCAQLTVSSMACLPASIPSGSKKPPAVLPPVLSLRDDGIWKTGNQPRRAAIVERRRPGRDPSISAHGLVSTFGTNKLAREGHHILRCPLLADADISH